VVEEKTFVLPDDPEDDPVLGSEGYPHDMELQRIRTWPDPVWPGQLFELDALMQYVRARWRHPEYWEERDVIDEEYKGQRERSYKFSTGGWSGNESLVGAMEEHPLLGLIAPTSWRRGGHYEYRLPLPR
jgi:hypothetical protein